MRARLLRVAPAVLAAPLLAASDDLGGAAPAFEWKHSTPEQQGVDSEMLLRSVRRVRDEQLEIRSLVLLRNDHVILELYVHPYTRDTVHNVKSVSKSILSALVGIAVREGVIRELDQPVREFLPEYFPEAEEDPRNHITLRHLLTMTSGLDLDENGPKMQAVFASDDWIRATFQAGMVADPGERFVYSTPLTHAMVGILTAASGQSVLDFADEHLFGPMQFGPLQWTRGPQGLYFGGSELFLRTRDMAKFGRLYLHGGLWQERQLVPAEWVAASTRMQLPDGSAPYGYWWWVDGDGGGFKARGWGGQGISVRPDLRLVVAGTAGSPTAGDRMFRGFDPATFRDEPLPANPQAVAALQELTRELQHPDPDPVPPLSPLALDVSGRTYRLDENPRGFRAFTFRFEEGSPTATVVTSRRGRTVEAAIGLDGVYRFTDMGTEGPMPERNRVALRGRWNADDEFVIDSHQVGDPVHGRWTMRFDGDRLDAEAQILPTGQRLTLTGQAAP